MTCSTKDAPTIGEAKDRARRLRALRAARGRPTTRAAALERIAKRCGYRNWNTLRAVAPRVDADAPTRHGARVEGRYMDRAFAGRVMRIVKVDGGWRTTILFDAPVDVSASPRFSVLRQRVSVVLDRFGAALARGGDGRPHLVLAAGDAAR